MTTTMTTTMTITTTTTAMTITTTATRTTKTTTIRKTTEATAMTSTIEFEKRWQNLEGKGPKKMEFHVKKLGTEVREIVGRGWGR